MLKINEKVVVGSGNHIGGGDEMGVSWIEDEGGRRCREIVAL